MATLSKAGPTPWTANVCPKSSFCFSKPISLATSKIPNTPIVEFMQI